MLESCDGDLKRRSDVWDWVDEPWRLLQTSQCQFGRCDQKHTDIFMNRAMWTRAARVFTKPRCARTRSPRAQLTTRRKHRLTTQDVRGSRPHGSVHENVRVLLVTSPKLTLRRLKQPPRFVYPVPHVESALEVAVAALQHPVSTAVCVLLQKKRFVSPETRRSSPS